MTSPPDPPAPLHAGVAVGDGRARRAAPDLPFEPGELPPRAVVWLHPWELLRTAYRALLSTAATGFLDRREMLAALNPPREAPADSQPGVLRPSADGRTLRAQLPPGQEALWIDYVADIGDSWDATYATTKLIAQGQLEVTALPNSPLPGAHIVALGGDLVYPWPSRDGYRTRTRSAFMAALPEQPARAPSLVAIPGNHDWYDGLTSFVREFCQGGMLGGWRLAQNRSYFAAKLLDHWWLWGIDIALDLRIDSPQQAYFLQILLDEQDPLMNIILCTAKPVWMDNPRHSTDAYNNLAFFADQVRKHGAAIPVMLAGDVHHYSRFESPSGEQMIVCGGGGAYVVGTHQVPLRVPRVEGRRSHLTVREQHKRARRPGSRQNAVGEPAEREDRQFRASEFCYPSRDESKRLALGALLLVRRFEHWPFLLFLGVVSALFAWLPAHPISRLMAGSLADFGLRLGDALAEPLPLRAALSAAAILLICTAYAASASLHGSWILRLAWGALHGVAHMILALWVFTLFGYPGLHLTLASFSTWLPQSFAYVPVAWLARLLAYVVLAGAAGITLLGVYLVVSDRVFGWHSDEVFSFQGIYDYRSFLRMRLDRQGALTIYPIGLQRVPRRWRARAAVPRDPAPMDDKNPGLYEPGDAVLRPHVIEAPITIRPQAV